MLLAVYPLSVSMYQEGFTVYTVCTSLPFPPRTLLIFSSYAVTIFSLSSLFLFFFLFFCSSQAATAAKKEENRGKKENYIKGMGNAPREQKVFLNVFPF